MAVLRRLWAWLEKFAADPRKMLLVDVALTMVIGGLALVFWLDANQTHSALCKLRADLEKRVENAETFLADHPNLNEFRFGPVVIKRSQLVLQAKNQRATLESLDNLNC